MVSAGAFGQGVLAVLDPQTGQPVWHKQVKPSHGNALRLWRAGPEIVLAVSREMLALNPSDGSVVWSMESTEGITKTAALAGNLRLVATRENLAVVDSSLGEKVATFDTINAAEGLVARAVPDGAVVYAVDGTGVRAWKIALPRH